MTNKVLVIDPPSGWKYGFPRPVPADFGKETFSLSRWLVECGYPVRDIPFASKYSRYWEAEVINL